MNKRNLIQKKVNFYLNRNMIHYYKYFSTNYFVNTQIKVVYNLVFELNFKFYRETLGGF